jgi:hypothetical protein
MEEQSRRDKELDEQFIRAMEKLRRLLARPVHEIQ